MSNWTSSRIKVSGDGKQVAGAVAALVCYKPVEQTEAENVAEPLYVTRISLTSIRNNINPVNMLSLHLHWSDLTSISGTFDGTSGFVTMDFGTKSYNPVNYLADLTVDYQIKIEFNFWQESGIEGSATIENGQALDYREWPDGQL